jgi:hypothetical protein
MVLFSGSVQVCNLFFFVPFLFFFLAGHTRMIAYGSALNNTLQQKDQEWRTMLTMSPKKRGGKGRGDWGFSVCFGWTDPVMTGRSTGKQEAGRKTQGAGGVERRPQADKGGSRSR